MYEYKIPSTVSGQATAIASGSKTKSVNDLLEEIKAINAKFSSSGTDVSGLDNFNLEKMQFNGKTENQIKEQSETLLAEYKNQGIKNIENEIKNKEDEVFKNKSALVNQNEQNKELLKGYYENAKTSASNQALKRGLSRSSIVINELNAFDTKQLADFKALDSELSEKINALNFTLNSLQGQKEKALNDFNISYAVKLQEKIDQITTDLDKRQQEVIKYNNEIALKEQEFNKELAKLKTEIEKAANSNDLNIAELYGKYGPNVIAKFKADEIYNTTKNYLLSLPKQKIIDILDLGEIKASLGTDNYNKLRAELGV